MIVTAVRGEVSNVTPATTWAITAPQSFAANELAVLTVAYDNGGAAGVDPFVSITDALGNTWTSVVSAINNAGVNLGTVNRIFTCAQNVANIVASTIITISFGAISVTSKAAELTGLSSSFAGTSVIAFGGTATNTGNSNAASVVSASLIVGQCLVGSIASEQLAVLTGDSDTTNGTWTAIQQISANTGSASTSQVVGTQAKVITGTGTQTYNNTCSGTPRWASCLAYFQENPLVASIPVSLDVMYFTSPQVFNGGTPTPSLVNYMVLDRIMETSTVTGTDPVVLLGAVLGYLPFSKVRDTNLCTFCIVAVDTSDTPTGEWEICIGQYSTTGPTLTRLQVRASSNNDQMVLFSAGTKRVFLVNDSVEIRLKPIYGVTLALANKAPVP